MPLYALGELEPRVHPDAFVHPEAVLIGDVVVGAESWIGPGAVLRGDDGYIRVGSQTSVQDGCVLHTTPEWPTIVGDRCVVGHIVHLEACTIEDDALVGNGSVVLHRAVVRSWALVGSQAVLPNDFEVPSGAMALGVPAKLRLDSVDPAMISEGVASYVARTHRYKRELRRLG
jgi:carbonic anhydrase/acetyltransferase-like protein (isoleucine patch superfamily)